MRLRNQPSDQQGYVASSGPLRFLEQRCLERRFLEQHCLESRCLERRCRARERSGIATLWVILFVPLLLFLFCFVIEIANIWYARVELENSLEAAALAAVKQWGDENGGLGTGNARNVGVNYAAANTINDAPVEIGPNLGVVAANNPNFNKLCLAGKSDMNFGTPAPDGNLVFGAIEEDMLGVLTFDASRAPSCGAPCGVFIKVTGNQDDLKTCDGWKICFEDCDDDALLKKIVIDISNATNPPLGNGWAFQNAIGESPNFACGNSISPSNFFFTQTSGRDRTLTIEFEPPLDPDDFLCVDNSYFQFGLGIGGFGQHGLMSCPHPIQGNVADQLAVIGTTVQFFFDVNGDCIVSQLTLQNGDPCDFMAFGELSGGGGSGQDFGVRAQATILVKSICCHFCGIDFGPFCVSTCATARYNCETMRPRLVRIEEPNFFCMPGNGADP